MALVRALPDMASGKAMPISAIISPSNVRLTSNSISVKPACFDVPLMACLVPYTCDLKA